MFYWASPPVSAPAYYYRFYMFICMKLIFKHVSRSVKFVKWNTFYTGCLIQFGQTLLRQFKMIKNNIFLLCI